MYEPVVDHELERQDTTETRALRFPPEEFLTQYAQLWQAPQPRRFADFYHPQGRMHNPDNYRPLRRVEIPGYYTFLLSAIPDLRLQRLSWAGDQHLLYVEWQARGTFVNKPLQLNLVDRFEFLEGRVIFGQAYFDTVALLSVIEPSINTVQFALSAVRSTQ
jgi:hypothetical protein